MRFLKKSAALLLSAAVFAGMWSGSVSAVTPSHVAGTDGYVSTHKYISRTDETGVYKVTHTLQADIEKPAAFVTFVLDTSFSMDWAGIFNKGSDVSRRKGVAAALRAAIKKLEEKGAEIDLSNTYVNIIHEDDKDLASASLTRDMALGKYTRTSVGGSPVTPSGLGVIKDTGFVPFMDETGTTVNEDLELTIQLFEARNAISVITRSDSTQGSGSNMMIGFRRAYEDLEKALLMANGEGGDWEGQTGTHPKRLQEPKDIEEAQKFIMVLGDGDVIHTIDTATPQTDAAQALMYMSRAKTEILLDANGKMTVENLLGTNARALGAEVWTSVWGDDGAHRTDWRSIVNTGSLPSFSTLWTRATAWSQQQAISLGGGAWLWQADYPDSGGTSYMHYIFVEPFMIATAMPVSRPQMNGPALTATTSRWNLVPALQEYYQRFGDFGSPNYYWVQHIADPLSASGTLAATGNEDLRPVDTNRYKTAYLKEGDALKLGSENGITAFENFIEAMQGISPSVAKAALSGYFDLYQYKSEPLVAAYEDGVLSPGAASASGKNVSWNLPELEDGVLYSLVFYVKIKDGLDPELSYPVCDTTITLNGVSFAWEETYISSKTGEKDEDAGQGAAETLAGAGNGYTGMDGHQDNRENAKNTGERLPYSADLRPLIRRLYTGTAANGRTKVIAELENGRDMRYQWQYKADEERDQWTDIFGATSSQYVLSADFKAGKTYTLRCKIINPAGSVTYSEAIQVKAAAAASKGSLQSKAD